MSMPKRLSAVVIGSALLVVSGAGLASADPKGPYTTASPQYRQLAGVGSDTTQDVMNGLADSAIVDGVKVLASYNAIGSATIATNASAGCASVARPNGSGAGRTALLNSLNAGDGCVQFARSSSLDTSASSQSLTYIPFATDAVSYAVTTSSGVSRTLNMADLQKLYTCDVGYVGTSAVPASDAANTFEVTPVLPQAGSGTRKYWMGKMGISEAQITAGTYPCIINGTKNGQAIEEHTGTVVDDKSLVPFSIAQYNSQATLVIADKRGRTVLGSIGTGTAGGSLTGVTYPSLLNGGFNVKRPVYNIVPTSKLGQAPYSQVFVGGTSLVCADTATIQKFGFIPSADCGSTSAQSASTS